MDEQKYVIAIALAEQNNKRLMPLGGKTFSGVDTLSQSSKKEVEKIILDLLLRIFQRTTEGSLKISNDETGLLLAEISFESMHNNIPVIKSNWINSGDTDTLIEKQYWEVYNKENETDNYKHEHYLFHFNHNMSNNSNIHLALHYTFGRGYYEQFREADNLNDYSMQFIFNFIDYPIFSLCT